MVPLRLALFGAPCLEREGVTVAIPRRKTLALLAYLAVTRQPHSRETLAAFLWPEDEPEIARASLRRSLSEIRQIAGEQVLVVDRSQVRLNPEVGLSLDIAEFKQLVTGARQPPHSQGEPCQNCLADLTTAVELYTGDFMAGFGLPDSSAFDEWQFFEAESLRQSLAGSLQTLVDLHSNLDSYTQAIPFARRWVALDPLNETAQRSLIRLYASSGQPAAALRQFQEITRLLKDELGQKPERETVALAEAVRARAIPAPPPGPESRLPGRAPAIAAPPEAIPTIPHNLPPQPAALVGRGVEISRITALLTPEHPCRLATLTGPGGSGKTRLAVEVASVLAAAQDSAYTDGIWFISLAPVSSAPAILEKIAQAFDYSNPEGNESHRQKILRFLHPKRMLLLLDNFEHLITPESTSLVAEILSAAPKVKILVTSREQLNIRDEQICPVAGLQVPAEAFRFEEDTTSYEAVQLFRQCAGRVRPDFELGPANLPAVARICRLVQGLPLAIELAAAWLEVLSPAEIAGEIERSLDILEAGWHDLPERQHSLRAVFESSWSLLNEAERQALVTLAVFKGGFSRPAADVVGGASLKTLLNLVHKSWIIHGASGRYSIHELLRQYASEKLRAAPDLRKQVMEGYCAYYAAFLEVQGEAMKGHAQRKAYEAIEAEFENIQIAWEWLVKQEQVPAVVERMLPALFLFCDASSRKGLELQQMVALAGEVLLSRDQRKDYPGLLAILLIAKIAFDPLGYPVRHNVITHWSLQDMEHNRYLLLRGKDNSGVLVQHWEAEVTRLSDPEIIAWAWSLAGSPDGLLGLGFWGILLAYFYGRILDHEQGAQSIRALAAHLRAHGRRWEEALAFYSLGATLGPVLLSPDIDPESVQDEVEFAFKTASQIFDEVGDLLENGYALRYLGFLYGRKQDNRQAIQYWLASIDILKQGGDRRLAASISLWVGELYLSLCEFETATKYYQIYCQEFLELGELDNAAYGFSMESMKAARYGDLKQARKMREKSLELSSQVDDLYGLAWHTWEMGEICRLEGDLTNARRLYDQAHSLFFRFEMDSGLAFYFRSLGDLDQMAGRFDEAKRHFQESLNFAQKIGHMWATVCAMAGLGRAETSLGQYEAAEKHFRDVYKLSWREIFTPLMLVALAGQAGLLAAKGERERAANLARIVLWHQAAWNETKAQTQALLQGLGVALPADEASREGGCSIAELDEAVRRVEPEFAA